MASDKELINQKYSDIRKEFQKWKNKTYENICIYTESYILKKLSEQYYLAPRTIENIVYYRVGYKTKNKATDQTRLF